MAGHPGYWRDADGAAVQPAEAQAAWAEAALPVLREVATVYGALIDYPGFSAEVQQRTGIHTRLAVNEWIGGVLRTVMAAARREGEPPLTVLVVPKIDASVGATLDSRPRLQCYQRYGAAMPAEAMTALLPPAPAGRATRTPRAASTRVREPKPRPAGPTSPAERAEKAPALCPRCFIALPATGVCDTCG